jgi:hypothetical protein
MYAILMFAHTLMDRVPYTVEKTNNFQKKGQKNHFTIVWETKRAVKRISISKDHNGLVYLRLQKVSDYLMMCY